MQDILIDIRYDLINRITEQKGTLKLAKEQVSKVIQGNTALNEISRLQITRLDSQIEQFEQLQRVLVKM
jgi:hypothetical protein